MRFSRVEERPGTFSDADTHLRRHSLAALACNLADNFRRLPFAADGVDHNAG